jgi:hypothetical protein
MKARKDIKSIVIAEECQLQDPCCHDVTITYNDGRIQENTFTAIEIAANLELYLIAQKNHHFDSVKNSENPLYEEYMKMKHQISRGKNSIFKDKEEDSYAPTPEEIDARVFLDGYEDDKPNSCCSIS